MSILDELACEPHQDKGYEPGCLQCQANVHGLVSLHLPKSSRPNTPQVVTGLLVLASPTIARKAYWALSNALQGKTLSMEDNVTLRALMDLMQDCVEKPR